MLPSILGPQKNSTDQGESRMAPVSERMSRVDTAWLRMDNDVNLMMIVGIWLLTPAITRAAPPARKASKKSDADSESDWLTDAVVKPLSEFTVKAIGMYGSGVAKSMEVLSNPSQPLFGGLDMARTGVQVVSDVAAMAMMADDSPTLLKGKPIGSKRVAWGEPLPLDQVKAVGKALNCSVND